MMSKDEGCGVIGFVFFVFILILFGICSQFIGCDVTYSEGFRDGVIQKFSHKGLLVKSYEGELLLQQMNMKGNQVGFEVWPFSVDDERVVEQLKTIPAGQILRLHYRQVYLNAGLYHATDYRITKVEVLKGN